MSDFDAEESADSLQTFTDEIFGYLPRADQRRWARVYLQGLIRVAGKKSIGRMACAAASSPTAAHGLRQFVNSSPWEWMPARRALARLVLERADPTAWYVSTCAIPKRGNHSVGVRRQFVAEDGRVLNCQLAAVLFLATDRVLIPVDWRLLLDERWFADDRRRRARIPASVRPQGLWAHLLDFVDDTVTSLPGGSLPLVADIRDLGGEARAEDLIGRAQPFLLEISPTHPVGLSDRGASVTAQQLLSRPSRELTVVRAKGPDASSRVLRSTTVTPPRTLARPFPGGGGYRLVSEHVADGRPARYWITHRIGQPVEQTLTLIAQRSCVGNLVSELQTTFGMSDFEGRSYPGWHHHMTLVSVAYAYSRISRSVRRSTHATEIRSKC
ncbi:IS701 family transposase [Nocardia pseudobrasiliensis]|uniref:SRSO17 transposase n=1 Tax=Nocardia pseudobrasiliensis TaxID=45979 RepID=A0A370I956_9NOCA|nr:transposase [Nocardia pseudobrasiliensis]RDI67253.1 SRSO17 transposase [Nocardia pseudobrasiliensis]